MEVKRKAAKHGNAQVKYKYLKIVLKDGTQVNVHYISVYYQFTFCIHSIAATDKK